MKKIYLIFLFVLGVGIATPQWFDSSVDWLTKIMMTLLGLVFIFIPLAAREKFQKQTIGVE